MPSKRLLKIKADEEIMRHQYIIGFMKAKCAFERDENIRNGYLEYFENKKYEKKIMEIDKLPIRPLY